MSPDLLMPANMTSGGHCQQPPGERFGAYKCKCAYPSHAERCNSSITNADVYSCQQKTQIDSRASKDDVTCNQYLSTGGLSEDTSAGYHEVGSSSRNPADAGRKCSPNKNLDGEISRQESTRNTSNDKSWPSPDLRLKSQQLLQQQMKLRGFTPRLVSSSMTSHQSAITTRIDEGHNANKYG